MKIIKTPLIFLLMMLCLTGCKQDALLTGLEQQQANEVIALLQKNNIQAVKREVAKEGISIAVDSRDFVASVDLLNTYGLPRPRRLEIAQMFPSDSLVSSPRAEKARLYSGIEQRLEQSLLSLYGVVSARVHISYDLGSGEDERKNIPIHISSIVNYDNNVTDATLLIGDVKRFLKNSFDDVNYDNISVVLSKTIEVQRVAPISLPGSSSLWMTGGALIILLFFIGMMLIILFIKQSHSPIVSRMKKHVRLTGAENKKIQSKSVKNKSSTSQPEGEPQDASI